MVKNVNIGENMVNEVIGYRVSVLVSLGKLEKYTLDENSGPFRPIFAGSLGHRRHAREPDHIASSRTLSIHHPMSSSPRSWSNLIPSATRPLGVCAMRNL